MVGALGSVSYMRLAVEAVQRDVTRSGIVGGIICKALSAYLGRQLARMAPDRIY